MATQKDSPSRRKRTRLAALAAAPHTAAAKPSIAISGVAARAVQEPVSKRSYVIITVETDAGISGVGELAARPDPGTAVRKLLAIRPLLVGQDAASTELVRKSLARANVSSLDRAEIQAAVNMALLDIMGKLTAAPVYEVLGGPTRGKARALACFDNVSPPELAGLVREARQSGFAAFMIPLFVPAGPTRGRSFYRRTLKTLEDLRQSFGADVDFVLDCHAQTSPAEAAGLAREFERFHLLWLEEPCAGIHRKSLAKISAETVTPVGFGRQIVDNGDFQELLRLDAIDVLRPDIRRSGITQIRKAAALAETYYVAVAPYHRGGPIATAAALQLAASIPNFFIQQVPYPTDERDRRMRAELAGAQIEAVDDGFLSLPSAHGLGIALNQDALERYQINA